MIGSSNKDFHFYIDVVGTCNLKCPSCPVGNSNNIKTPKGIMQPELLNQIMLKATGECNVTGVGLYNWTEPLLHPELPQLIKIVQSYGVPCAISTNLNILNNPDELMAANAHSLYVSLSGFAQENYGVTHQKGDVEKVKQNIRTLAESKSRMDSKTNIVIIFHRYKNNRNDELLMQEFARDLGVKFMPMWALMMPLEKVLLTENVEIEGHLTREDVAVLERFALPIDAALRISKKYKDIPCRLLGNELAMNVLGNVALCCAVYDSEKYGIANFLEVPLEEIQRRRVSNKMCAKCISAGAHIYMTYGAREFETIAMSRYE